MSTFTDALHGFVTSSEAYTRAVREDYPATDQHELDRLLAQAGDSLESEVRRMMREERGAVMFETFKGRALDR